MSVRDQLVDACAASDLLAVRRLGWWPVVEAANTWWARRQTCTLPEFGPFASLLGDEDPTQVLDAFRALAGEWRPPPSRVYAHLHPPKKNDERFPGPGAGHDRTATPEAWAAVREARANGEHECTCGFHRPTWAKDVRNVLRCKACRGLEPGQAHDSASEAA